MGSEDHIPLINICFQFHIQNTHVSRPTAGNARLWHQGARECEVPADPGEVVDGPQGRGGTDGRERVAGDDGAYESNN